MTLTHEMPNEVPAAPHASSNSPHAGRALRILHLTDGRPGHYHLSEGVIAAIARGRKVDVETLMIRRRALVPARFMARVLTAGQPGRPWLLRSLLAVGYGLDCTALSPADLIISAGGDTLAANVATARLNGATNIFCGSLRHVPPKFFSLVVSSYDSHARLPRHLVCLKPTAMDPDRMGRTGVVAPIEGKSPPKLIVLLIGGDSGLFKYTDDEWRQLLAFVETLNTAWGSRWLVSTSRRTPGWVGDALSAVARRSAAIETFVDYRTAGPGTLPALLARADAALCTEDSSTMISEAIAARLPVVGVAPQSYGFKREEAEYRRLMINSNWCRFLALEQLNAATALQCWSEVRPLKENHLELLSQALRSRLPELF